jgi:hypothetical protein
MEITCISGRYSQPGRIIPTRAIEALVRGATSSGRLRGYRIERGIRMKTAILAIAKFIAFSAVDFGHA